MFEANANRQNKALRKMVLNLKARLQRAAEVVKAAQVDQPKLLELHRLKQLERSAQEYQPGWCAHRDTYNVVAMMKEDFVQQNHRLYGSLQAIYEQAVLTPSDPELIRAAIVREFYSISAE